MITLKWTVRATMVKKTNATPPHSDGKQGVDAKTRALLHSLFYDVTQPSAYRGKENVLREVRRVLASITRQDVNDWFEEQLTYTLHKPVRLRFARNKTIVMAIDDQWQADLCDMQSRASVNDDNTFILT